MKPILAEQESIQIDVADMISRAQYGQHLTCDEARWLLSKIGRNVPAKERRCEVCGESGVSRSVPTIETCGRCNGRGRYKLPEPVYVVIWP